MNPHLVVNVLMAYVSLFTRRICVFLPQSVSDKENDL